MTQERRREITAKYRESHREELRLKGREYARAYRAENPEIMKAATAAYRDGHREQLREKARQRTREATRAACRKWSASHQDYERLRRKKYLEEHPELNRARARRRRALKMQAVGSHTQKEIDEILQRQKNKCADCKRKFTRKRPATLDHVTPISKGGSESADNLRWICKSCNSQKSAKSPEEWAARAGLLFI